MRVAWRPHDATTPRNALFWSLLFPDAGQWRCMLHECHTEMEATGLHASDITGISRGKQTHAKSKKDKT
jgi:hypothetical protein